MNNLLELDERAEKLTIDLPTAGIQLSALAWGPPGGRPVFALHGWLDNAASFSPLSPYLEGCRLVAVDLPGHGGSGQLPLSSWIHYPDYLPLLLEALDRLGWDQCTLLGHSLGAGLATLIAALFPQKVSALAAIEGIGPLTAPADQALTSLRRSLTQLRRHPDRKLPTYSSCEAAISARHQAGDLSLEAARILASRNLVEKGDGVGWRTDPRLTLRSPVYLMEEQVLAILEGVEAPTLLIKGDRGLLVGRPEITERCQRFDKLEIVELSGGHHLHMDDAKAVGTVITDFFQREG
ncbi:MAG: alpha/beta hydrolase [Arenicellales bacterium]|jgi:pimeloyl-ACP methyl ester carboxylesterase|nr:alpha/beta hydrolase [Arenicellales bacterium]MDP7284013.1 alpha/beta hydrolase [Arenicellales bacterium]MDP7481446.1 alpha/beta hydrolase [Arenicellales bacterium]MDP7522194.1 alpha/beta hydrolase [Arenicellales bacterium]MEE1540078.1 alpha/beta hydrolase [Arenicellales bacterium]|tara:strand:- start:8392 stop:9273 length:882 start_codon:yes stop_codon:yes gene_type:complete